MENSLKVSIKEYEATNSLIASYHLQFGAVQEIDVFRTLCNACSWFFEDTLKPNMDDSIFPTSCALVYGIKEVLSADLLDERESIRSLNIAREAVVNMLFALRQSYQSELEAFRKNNNL